MIVSENFMELEGSKAQEPGPCIYIGWRWPINNAHRWAATIILKFELYLLTFLKWSVRTEVRI